VYGARAEKPHQNADFAMKQTNICRLSGDIMIYNTTRDNKAMYALIVTCKRHNTDNKSLKTAKNSKNS